MPEDLNTTGGQPQVGSTKWLAAVERGDRISTYAMYLDYLARDGDCGALSCQQFAEQLIRWLAGNRHTQYLRRVTDACLNAERWLTDEAANVQRQPPAT